MGCRPIRIRRVDRLRSRLAPPINWRWTSDGSRAGYTRRNSEGNFRKNNKIVFTLSAQSNRINLQRQSFKCEH